MAATHIDDPNPNACAPGKGMLSLKYGKQIVKRINVLTEHVEFVMPPGVMKPKVISSDEGIIHDWSNVRFASGAAAVIRPLQLIASNEEDDPPGRTGGPGVRVVKGGTKLGNKFWYADPDMDPIEQGTIGHPYFYVSSVSDGDFIWIELTVSLDGFFWKTTDSIIDSGATLPTEDTTHLYVLLGAVSVDAGIATVIGPQEFYGNLGVRRVGVISGFTGDLWLIR